MWTAYVLLIELGHFDENAECMHFFSPSHSTNRFLNKVLLSDFLPYWPLA
jgi:hypothetical protein